MMLRTTQCILEVVATPSTHHSQRQAVHFNLIIIVLSLVVKKQCNSESKTAKALKLYIWQQQT